MKRVRNNDSNNYSNSNRNINDPELEDIFSRLQNLERHKLLAIIDESNRLLSYECSCIVSSIPDDLWQIIFTFCMQEMNTAAKTSNIVNQLRLLSCVSIRWSLVVNEMVRIYFSLDRCYSPWILSRFADANSLKVDLTHAEANELSIPIKKMTNLTSLFIPHYAKIQKPFDDFLESLSNLTELEIPYDIMNESNNTRQLARLKTLKIDCWWIIGKKAMNCEVMNKLTSLTHLKFKSSQKESVSDEALSLLTNLTFLKARGQLSYSNLLSKLPKLNSLVLGDDSSMIDEELREMTNLTSLVQDCPLITSKGITALTNLTHLEINPIIHGGIDSLVNLTSLSIIYSREIFESLKYLTNLQNLKVSSISRVTLDVAYLTNLKSLSLISEVQVDLEEVARLTNLTKLDISTSSTFSDDQLKLLTNLKKLNCHDNPRISHEGIEPLTNLTSLDVRSNCETNDISSKSGVSGEGIENLTNLTTLKFQDNSKITPNSLKKLINLTRLEMNANFRNFEGTKITFESIRHLTNLTSLACSPNLLSVWEKRNFPYLRQIEYVKVYNDEDVTVSSDGEDDSDDY